MPGGGTKLDTTKDSAPPARLFEMTRTMTLYSGQPTGIDRVCLAYLRALCDAPEPVFGLIKTALGYVLLDDAGMQAIRDRLEGKVPWGPSDFLSRVLHKESSYKRHTEAELRRHCIARCPSRFLGRMLRKHLPSGTTYINVDHAHLPERKLTALKSIPDCRIVPFVHDTIPLDFPEYQTTESVVRFQKLLHRIGTYADLILCNSEVSRESVTKHLSGQTRVPQIKVAHLGVEADFFRPGDNSDAPDIPSPYFVCLGTIEPRKNHAFLLEIWDELEAELTSDEMPHLVICGRRGWLNEEVFERLDTSPQRGRLVHEFNDLDDAVIAAVMLKSAGSLFPSLCEGFGLPPVESAALGVPVVCNDLRVFREFLGDIPIYANVSDRYAWKQAIIQLARQARSRGNTNWQEHVTYVPPDWGSHFNVVLKMA